MNRDLDLCREILQQIEGRSELHVRLPRVEGRSEEEVHYHATLLSEAGLLWSMMQKRYPEAEGLQAEALKPGKYSTPDRYRLTWAAHEFLDAARNDSSGIKPREQ